MVPLTMDENDWLFDHSIKHAEFCSGGQGSTFLWLGADDNDVERQWEYSHTNNPIPWDGPWRGGNPNGGTVENCLVMLFGSFSRMWNDIACLETYQFCVPCEFKKISTLYLKGPALCNTSPFNIEYILETTLNNKPAFTGFLHSDILWDPDTSSWILKSLKVSFCLSFNSKYKK